MSNQVLDTRQGHWLLAKMGKKVLRPGGKELTLKLIEAMNFGPKDDVVEFAPGIGYTMGKVLEKNPKSYTGVELNEEAAAILRKKIHGNNRQIIIGNAAETNLADASADKVYGEAMLTMHVDKRKSDIIREAHRILRSGGYYGIHELGLTPDSLPDEDKAKIQRDLSHCIKVNARPLTRSEWTHLLEEEGFEIVRVYTNAMHLLEAHRIIDDEGFLRSLKITFNIYTHPSAHKRINEMKSCFKKYDDRMNGIAIVARKK